jgi:cytidylate kinase
VTGAGGLTIAIDGVIGAGKSTAARGAAAALGYRHLDTGAMYRAVALAASRRGLAPGDAALEGFLESLRLELPAGGIGGIHLDGEDVSAAIRSPEVSREVGAFADDPVVRRALVRRQREMGRSGGVVAEGRDMSTVVFPHADLKVGMVADLDERARRRHREFLAAGVGITLSRVRADIRRRDREDAERDYGVQGAAPGDAVEVDTSGLTADQVVDRIVALARERGA